MEYILNGLSSDDANLLKTIQSIQHIRTGLNLAYLYSDFSKRCQAKDFGRCCHQYDPRPLSCRIYAVCYSQLLGICRSSFRCPYITGR